MDDFNPLNEAHVASARAAVAEAVIGLRSGELPFVDAVRTISAHRFRLPRGTGQPRLLVVCCNRPGDRSPAIHAHEGAVLAILAGGARSGSTGGVCDTRRSGQRRLQQYPADAGRAGLMRASQFGQVLSLLNDRSQDEL